MQFSGNIRVYFNRHSLDGFVWIVATDFCEVAIKQVVLAGAFLSTKYDPNKTPAEGVRRHDGPPSAYFEGFADVEITEDSIANVRPLSII